MYRRSQQIRSFDDIPDKAKSQSRVSHHRRKYRSPSTWRADLSPFSSLIRSRVVGLRASRCAVIATADVGSFSRRRARNVHFIIQYLFDPLERFAPRKICEARYRRRAIHSLTTLDSSYLPIQEYRTLRGDRLTWWESPGRCRIMRFCTRKLKSTRRNKSRTLRELSCDAERWICWCNFSSFASISL